MNFKKFLEQNTFGTHNDFATSAYLPSDWTGTESQNTNKPFLPSLDLKIPQKTVNSTISNIIFTKNPITIELKDGTKIYLNIDEYRRLNSKPEIGKRITVVFQRLPNDNSKTTSKIEKIIIN